jgi:hypothetical protein
MFTHIATDGSLLSATFQDVRFPIKITFSSKIEIIYGCEGLSLNHSSSAHNSPPPYPFFGLLIVMNEYIVDVMCGCRALLSAKK